MDKPVLVAVSENGFWTEELLKSLARLKDAGYAEQFATPTGKLPYPDPASLDPGYNDPPLNRPVTFGDDLCTQAKRYGPDLSGKKKWDEVFSGLWSDDNVVIDRDLITGHSKKEVHTFINAIDNAIQRINLINPKGGN